MIGKFSGDIKVNPDFNRPPRPPSVILPYAALGVQFPGTNPNTNAAVYLRNPALLALNITNGNGGDNGRLSFSFWAQNFNFPAMLFISDPNNIGAPFFEAGGSLANPILQMSFARAPLAPGDFFTNWPAIAADGNWHHYLGSSLTLRPSGQKISVLYIDDVLQTSSSQTDTSGLYIAPMGGNETFIGGNGFASFGTKFNLSDVWIAPGEGLLDIDSSNNSNNNGILLPRISAADRRIFTTVFPGGVIIPNDPQIFPDASILLTGSASVFASNGLGFGGPFSIIGGVSLSDVPGPPRPV